MSVRYRLPLVIMCVVALGVAFSPPASAAAPHTTYGTTTSFCRACHAPHQASTDRFLFSVQGTATVSAEVELCYTCHDGLGASTNVKSGPVNSFGSSAMRSGHTLEGRGPDAPDGDLTDACSSCHYVHDDWTLVPRLPRPLVLTPGSDPATHTVTGANATWCLSCHNDAQDWHYSATSTPYPASAAPLRDPLGYPTLGTFPGRTVYLDELRNAHARIPTGTVAGPMVTGREVTRASGDCLWCHASHRSASPYDSLVATLAPSVPDTVIADRTLGTYAELCFACHGGGSWEASGAVDIKRFATQPIDDTSSTAGHRIKTAGAALPVDSPLPCYECHNPHGSARGNAKLLSDALGASLEATITGTDAVTSADGVRRFCLTCHATSDTTPRVWDSVNTTYAPVTAEMVYLGLRRDGTLLAGQSRPAGYTQDTNYLLLKALGSAQHAVAGDRSCYHCHGGSYALGGNNVHRPVPRPGGGVEPTSEPLVEPSSEPVTTAPVPSAEETSPAE